MRLVLAAVLLCGYAAAEEVTPVSALLSKKSAFDGKFACIAGKTSTLFTKYSRQGNQYFTIWVGESGAKIKVFGFGAPSFKEGEEIEACGKFTKVKKISNRVFYDEFSASVILKGTAMRSGRVVISSAGVQAVSSR